jgi:hypothetical protein
VTRVLVVVAAVLAGAWVNEHLSRVTWDRDGWCPTCGRGPTLEELA